MFIIVNVDFVECSSVVKFVNGCKQGLELLRKNILNNSEKYFGTNFTEIESLVIPTYKIILRKKFINKVYSCFDFLKLRGFKKKCRKEPNDKVV